MSSDKSELASVSCYLSDNHLDDQQLVQVGECLPLHLTHQDREVLHHLDRRIVSWGHLGVDDVSELLVCLLILFSQEDGEHHSQAVHNIFQGWRLVRTHTHTHTHTHQSI